ncbi:MAG TPA: cyanophycin synthetase, partial [Gemmatimonadaceae bacterium]|nr:cyanophycin synthetase [Gemmatimonadaceae bacterium]
AWDTLGRVTLINDAYNANPPSTRAALDLLAGAGGGRQRVAVIGSMRELGDRGAELHEEVARRALASSIDVIAGVGDFAAPLRALAPGDPRVITAGDVDELWTLLAPRLAADALILLKASRGVRLERMLPLLRKWAGLEDGGADDAGHH